jgi:hypothetical protein
VSNFYSAENLIISAARQSKDISGVCRMHGLDQASILAEALFLEISRLSISEVMKLAQRTQNPCREIDLQGRDPSGSSLISDGALAINAERARQKLKWSDEHDDGHPAECLARMGAAYALTPSLRGEAMNSEGPEDTSLLELVWPHQRMNNWHATCNRRDQLVRAGALIAAEIDRIDRQKGGSE